MHCFLLTSAIDVVHGLNHNALNWTKHVIQFSPLSGETAKIGFGAIFGAGKFKFGAGYGKKTVLEH